MSNSPLSVIDAALDASIAQINETDPAGVQRAAPSHRLTAAARFAGIALSALLSGDEEPMILMRVSLRPESFDEFDDGDANVSLSPHKITIEITAVPAHVNAAPEELMMPMMLYLAARAYVGALRDRDPAFLQDLADPARAIMQDALGAPAEHIAAARRRLGN